MQRLSTIRRHLPTIRIASGAFLFRIPMLKKFILCALTHRNALDFLQTYSLLGLPRSYQKGAGTRRCGAFHAWGNVEMKKICAWCQKPMNDEPEDGTPISHGICDQCVEHVMKDRTAIWFVLSSINSPQLAVDGDKRANTAQGAKSMSKTVQRVGPVTSRSRQGAGGRTLS